MSEEKPALVHDGGDPVVLRALERVAADGNFGVLAAGGEPPAELAARAAVVVVEVGGDAGIARIRWWRERSPQAVVVGCIGPPDSQLWREAERSGCDLVTSRGALAPQLRRWLAVGAGRRRRHALLDSADIAGRLGFIARVETTPVGPLAVFRVGGILCALEDRCPHAGSRLSEGILEGQVVTCPGHGSQFEVCSGERTRGPADKHANSYRLLEEGGRVFLELSTPAP